MQRIDSTLFPCLFLAGLFITLITGLIANPQPVDAAAPLPMTAGIQTLPDGPCSLSQNYPASVRQWCPLIEKYAQQYNLEATLIAAVIFQESRGEPGAYSSSGAVGLMQVMPRDGLAAGFMCINGPCFADRPTSQQLLDPEYNIAFGSQMLASLYQRYGSLREALRSYGPANAGYTYADLVLSIQQSYR